MLDRKVIRGPFAARDSSTEQQELQMAEIPERMDA